MDVSLNNAEATLSCIRKQANLFKPGPSMAGSSAQPSLTLPASTLMTGLQTVSTHCIPLDQLLGGGICRGQVLELSGPPGSPKEHMLLNVVVAFVQLGLEVVFLETQNMISPAIIHKALKQSESLPSGYMRLVRFVRLRSLPDFMIFIHGLGSFLEANPSTGLLVVNSISRLFQRDPTVTTFAKNVLLDQVKQIFSKACTQRQLTIVTTSQLATKMLKPDGSPGTFDDGARGVMHAQLGSLYLPSGKSHRVMIVPKGRTSG
ncbi:P-loop containing nucleoside triphosphate hydrolase protein [Amanita muscaria]